MFVWRVDTILKQIDRFLPHNSERLKYIGEHWGRPDGEKIFHDEFIELEKISIDYGVMERAVNVFMCELDCQWQDVGSYEALAENIGDARDDGNVTAQDTAVKFIDSGNNLVLSDSPDHFVALIHVEDMIVAHTADATLICHRDETDQLKKLLDEMQKEGFEKYT